MHIDFIASCAVLFTGLVSAYAVIVCWGKMRWRQRGTSLLFAVTLLLAANRMLFLDISDYRLGGLAEDGYAGSNGYYVGNHGRYHQVSAVVYRANLRYDNLSEWLSGAATFALLVVLLAQGFFRRPGSQWSLQSMMTDGDLPRSDIESKDELTKGP